MESHPASPTSNSSGSGRIANPGVRFPPPFLYVAGFLAGLLLDRRVAHFRLVGGDASTELLELAGVLLMATGLTFMGWGVLTFFRARTSIIPHRPASRMVDWGPYRFTRNPMYTGLAFLHAGLSLVANSGWPLLLLPLVMLALYHLVIRREERYLASEFGDEYERYRRRVRRWL